MEHLRLVGIPNSIRMWNWFSILLYTSTKNDKLDWPSCDFHFVFFFALFFLLTIKIVCVYTGAHLLHDILGNP